MIYCILQTAPPYITMKSFTCSTCKSQKGRARERQSANRRSRGGGREPPRALFHVCLQPFPKKNGMFICLFVPPRFGRCAIEPIHASHCLRLTLVKAAIVFLSVKINKYDFLRHAQMFQNVAAYLYGGLCLFFFLFR